MAIVRETVESSNLVSIGYDDELQLLEVVFKGGGRYVYAKVPVDVLTEFRAAESKGKFFAQRIKGAFEHLRVQ